MRILKKYIKIKALEANFEIWRKSDFADDYWTKRLRSSTARKSGRKAAEHVHKAIINEYAQLDKHLEGESALSDTTTDGSDYIESEQHFVYWLTFDELNDKSLKRSSSKYVLNKKQSTFNQRLGLSSITLIPAEEMFTLKRHSLNDDCYLMVRQFKRAVEESKLSIPADWSQSSDSLRPLLYCVLTYTLNIINIDRKHEHTKQDIVRTPEPNFINKYVA
ncbi:hypothetical protein F4703DRAFT_1845866 [Phycomyces blakesleeanus]